MEGETFTPEETHFLERAREAINRPFRTRPQDKRGKEWWSSSKKKMADVIIAGILSPLVITAFVGVKTLMKDIEIIRLPRKYPDIMAPFLISKFKTMRDIPQLSEENIAELKRRGYEDPRIIHPILRKLSLDELPQIIYDVIWYGTLALVGPRPLIDIELAILLAHQYEIPYATFLNALENDNLEFGVTGMYAIFGRKDLSLKTRIALENIYIEEGSFAVDLNIQLLTILAILSQRGAY